jgi:nitroimidazol reductase NimA-like FMN-containing flavoprotein (pyridoxamine 5'-phosphate oxidase superfamily)
VSEPPSDDSSNWEPALGGPQPVSSADEIPERIQALVESQRFCVLSTQGQSRPYASLLAFGVSEDLRQVVFATPVTTRKYALLKDCPEAAALFDTRSSARELMSIEAATGLGRAEELAPGSSEYAVATKLYLANAPQLEAFLRAPSCAVFSLRVERYLYVARFQDVHEWEP